MSESFAVFNRRIVRLHRDRAALHPEEFDFLFREAGERLADRLCDVTRRFPRALDLGCRGGLMARVLAGRGGIEGLVGSDLSPALAARAGGLAVAADEEWLPFAERAFDLVISNLALHWVNDLPGVFTQIRRTLRPGGLFLASLFGAGTLKELRTALTEAEIAIEGGLSPRISPFATVEDMGELLGRTGFEAAVADADTLVVSYADPWRLMADLRGMGEGNAMLERRHTPTRRGTFFEAVHRYQSRFADRDGRIPATFEILTLTAWRPPDREKR